RRGALSGVRRGSRASGRSRAARQSLPLRAPARGSAAVGERRPPVADRLYRPPVARFADRGRSGPEAANLFRLGKRALPPPPRPAEPLLQPVPRRQLGKAARRQLDPARAPDRLSGLPPGMAEPRLAAAAPAQLHDWCARRTVRIWRAR